MWAASEGGKTSRSPVIQPTKFNFVLNLKTMKTLNIEVPANILALADEVGDRMNRKLPEGRAHGMPNDPRAFRRPQLFSAPENGSPKGSAGTYRRRPVS